MSGNDSAFPTIEAAEFVSGVHPQRLGLTKRELFAAMAMQGLCAPGEARVHGSDVEYLALVAVKSADALLAELAKERK